MESGSDIFHQQGPYVRIGNDLYEMSVLRDGKEIDLTEETIRAIQVRILPTEEKTDGGLDEMNFKATPLIDRLIDADLEKQKVKIKGDKAPNIFMKIYEFFERIISPKRYEERHSSYAERLVAESPLKIEKTKQFGVKKNEKGIPYATMPKGIESSDEERSARLRNPHIGANVATQKKWHKNVEQLESGGIKVVGYKIKETEGKQIVKEGKVTPTSFVHAKVEQEKKGRLTNIYLAQGKKVMRSGVINTTEKAGAFIQAAKTLNAPIKGKKLRIVSNQLNSPEWEKSMITNQHQSLMKAAQKDKSVEIAHFVTPTNRFYHLAKSLGPLNFLWGERKAKENNLVGLLTYMKWIQEDCGDLGIEWPSEELLKNPKEVKKFLENAYQAIKDVQNPDDKLQLFKRFLGNQLDKKEDKMERGQELLTLHLLNQKMGVVSGVNCKSGLDRTGFVFSLMMGLLQMDSVKQMDMVNNWDRCTANLNKQIKGKENDTEAQYEWANQQNEDKEIYLAILEFRLRVFENLVRVGMPITATSTGLLGIKWEKGVRQNLVPLNFLPPMIKVEGEKDPVRIIEYDSKGEPSGLTERGHRLIVQLTDRREA